MNVKLLKTIVAGIVITSFASVISSDTKAVVSDNPRKDVMRVQTKDSFSKAAHVPQMPHYVPGEVLVKFKEGIDSQSLLEKLNLKVKSIKSTHSIKAAIHRFKKEYSFKKDAGGWYRFKGKQYKKVDDIPDEELFKEA